MEKLQTILTLVVGIACASVLFVEVTGFPGWVKAKMFNRLKSCWVRKYTDMEIEEMVLKDMLKESGAEARVRKLLKQVRRVPWWIKPFRRTKAWVQPDAWNPDEYVHFKPLDCVPCLSTWTSVFFSFFYCQNTPEFILLIGGTPIAALILTKLIRQ